jgi:hypothetical protein
MSSGDTGNLPYSISLTEGYPYMTTLIADVEDGLVNGAIGVLSCVEYYPTMHNDDESMRAWLEFDTEYIRRRVRLKYRPHVRSKPDLLNERWLPIEGRSSHIITARIKCRLQFPLLAACALTIHKSQGVTFNEIVCHCHKNHMQQLVYVALNRLTSLEGIFLTNATNDFTFYHAHGSTAPSIKEVQDEYLRLANHRLPTFTMDIKRLLDVATSDRDSVPL